MAWEWSHSVEAYQAVEQNIRSQSREWLITVYAEWQALDGSDQPDGAGFNEVTFRVMILYGATLNNEALADYIWERTEQHRTCENGGYLAHCCPFGCLCHMVSFDAPNPIPEQPE